MSIYVSDATAPNLADEQIHDLQWPCKGLITFESATGGAVDFTVEASDDSAMADAVTVTNVVGTIPASGVGDAGLEAKVVVDHRFVQITDNGSAPGDLVVTFRPLRYHWTKTQSAG